MTLVSERYGDFAPTSTKEKMSELHDLTVSKETLRKWMIDEGLQVTRSDRRRIYQPRNRRDCLGKLIQIDGPPYHWLENRGPKKCTLLVVIDVVTSRIMSLRFCPLESTFDYMAASKAYISEYGKPVASYSDKHSMFRTPKAALKTNL